MASSYIELPIPAAGGGGGSGDVLLGGNTEGSDISIGTNDNYDFNLETNGMVRVNISKLGTVGIGTPNADDTSKLDVYSINDGTAARSNIQSIMVLDDTSDGNHAQMSLYATNHAVHNTGTYSLLRNYLMSEMSGDGTVTETYGARAITRIFDDNEPMGDTSSGIIENAYGLEAYANNTSTAGKIRRATGIVISSARATGASDTGHDHTARGLWIQDAIIASGGDNNQAWSIDSESTADSRFYGAVRIENGKSLDLLGASNSNKISLKAPSGMSASVTYTLPPASDTGKYLKDSGSGTLVWDTPAGSGGGSGDVNFGGNSNSANSTIGLNDAYRLGIETNDSVRMNIESTGEVIVGANKVPSDLNGNPLVFGVYSFNTSDNNRACESHDHAFGYYGNSSTSKNGFQASYAVRPGETEYTYSGEHIGFVSDAYITSPGTVATLIGFKNSVAPTNGNATILSGASYVASLTAATGYLNKAYGFQAQNVHAKGSNGSVHEAIGFDIGGGGDGVIATGSSVSNLAVGLRISDNISASGTGASVYSILNNSSALSKFAGNIECADIRINKSPTSAVAVASTHKLEINLNGSTYYLLATT